MKSPFSLIIFLYCFVSCPVYGQTVRNNSFEQYTFCPNNHSQLSLVSDWKNVPNHLGTPDYYNACSNSLTVDVPANIMGYQKARTGNGYVGIYTYQIGDVREYIYAQLQCSLEKGATYYAEMYVNKSNNCALSINKLGMGFLTMAPVGGGSILPININPVIQNNSTVFLSDTSGWMKISGTFVADSAYQYIIIGNPENNNNTNTQPSPEAFDNAYYYIDDVYIVKISPDTSLFVHQNINNSCAGSTIELVASAANIYKWIDLSMPDSVISTNDTLNITITESKQYLVVAENSCSIQDTINVAVSNQFVSKKIKMPNVFTPNNDGINDYFAPIDTGISYLSFSMKILNRWGNEVYNKNAYSWDGLYNGEKLHSDIYYWVVEYQTDCAQDQFKQQGSVYLIQ